MVSFGEKAKIKKAGNLNQGCSYVIITLLNPCIFSFAPVIIKGLEISKGHLDVVQSKTRVTN